MPRLSQSTPRYRKHKASGQAIVTVHGVDHYLGPHGPAASRTQYDRLIAEYLANGRRRIVDRSITVNVLAAEFMQHVEDYDQKEGEPTTEQWEFRTACRLYGDQSVKAFGPLALKACRQEWIDAMMTRHTINKRQFRMARMFKWGVAEELVDSAVWEALRSVDTLHIGRTKVPEMKEVPPVELERVHAVSPFLSPVVRDMIGLHLLTGMRPGDPMSLILPRQMADDQDFFEQLLNERFDPEKGTWIRIDETTVPVDFRDCVRYARVAAEFYCNGDWTRIPESRRYQSRRSSKGNSDRPKPQPIQPNEQASSANRENASSGAHNDRH